MYSVISLLNPERCRDCQGRGSLGLLGEWHIICEACEGSGGEFRERMTLIREEGEAVN